MGREHHVRLTLGVGEEEGRWDDARVQISFSTEIPGAPADPVASRSGLDPQAPDLRARRIAIMVD